MRHRDNDEGRAPFILWLKFLMDSKIGILKIRWLSLDPGISGNNSVSLLSLERN